ncbi:hypothetical protein D3C73_1312690 [compost metagenome]
MAAEQAQETQSEHPGQCRGNRANPCRLVLRAGNDQPGDEQTHRREVQQIDRTEICTDFHRGELADHVRRHQLIGGNQAQRQEE